MKILQQLARSPQIQQTLAAWQARSPRERKLLLAALGVILVAVLWASHDSMRAERKRLDRVVPTAHAQLKSMQEQAAELARLSNQPRLPKLDATRQSDEIASAARTHGLTVQVKNEGGRLLLSGDVPQFNQLVSFVGSVQTALGMRHEMLDVSRVASGIHFELRLAPLN